MGYMASYMGKTINWNQSLHQYFVSDGTQTHGLNHVMRRLLSATHHSGTRTAHKQNQAFEKQ
jgi:hypothetical protein